MDEFSHSLTKRESKKHTFLLLLLGLLSFGGGTGRFAVGLGLFDLLLLYMFIKSIQTTKERFLRISKSDLRILAIFSAILFLGVFRTFAGREGLEYDYIITEIRFFLYFPVLYIISCHYRLNLKFISRILPYLILTYIIIWAILLIPGSFLFNIFNDDLILTIGDQQRFNGPSVLILVPIFLLLIHQKIWKLSLLILYSVLILLIFIKTGGRTYFLFYLFPFFFLLFKNRKNMLMFVLSVILIVSTFFILKEFTGGVFFERFLKVTNPSEDSSFMYRIYNIEEMLNRLNGEFLWIGNGIGSNYDVYLFGLKESFFLDNTFVTLIYKIGILGALSFFSIFLIKSSRIPRDLYVFEILSVFLIASISYHIILNPVFIFGYFLIFNYFKHNLKLENNPLLCQQEL